MDILEAKNLNKNFGKFVAVNNLSFSLKEGEILGFLGPNGAGKTTTIQMLLGVLTPSSGEVFYFGKNLKHHREEILEQVNFSSTYTNLPWDLTVQENLNFISYLYKIENRKKKIAELAEIFMLKELLKERTGTLSAGQMTRVNVAKAFINNPKVLLLDEPTASLDPDVADYIRKFLENERKQFKTSVIFTSHNMAEVEEVCDRVIFINHGKIVANDTAANLTKTIQKSHLEFFSQNADKLINYCKSQNKKVTLQGRKIIVELLEKEIAEFLYNMAQAKVTYDEISILKPTLEDFFIEQAERKDR